MCASLASHAQSTATHPMLGSKFAVNVGAFYPTDTFKLRVQGSVDNPITGDKIDFDKDLSANAPYELGAVEALWRFGEKWSLRGQYVQWDDSTSAVLREDVTWGDIVFGAGTGIGAGMSTSVTRLFFARTFIVSDKHHFGLGLGGHRIALSAYIEGAAIIDGVPSGVRHEKVATNGVLPNLGVWYNHAFNDRWAFRARLDWLGADVGKYDGQIINAAVGFDVRMFEHVGLGVSYNLLELDFGVDEDSWDGDVVSRSHGPFVSLNFYF